jgi:hypothetical protein
MMLSPEASSYGESVSTLNFAKRVSEVTLGQVGGCLGQAHLKRGMGQRADLCQAPCGWALLATWPR